MNDDERQDHLKLGFQVLDEMYVDQADERLPRSGPLRSEDRKFLSRCLSYYEQFASQESNDPGVRVKLAKAHLRVADILRKLGQSAPALDSYGKAIAAFERLSRAFPSEGAYKEDWATSLNNRAMQLLELGRGAEAERDHSGCSRHVARSWSATIPPGRLIAARNWGPPATTWPSS